MVLKRDWASASLSVRDSAIITDRVFRSHASQACIFKGPGKKQAGGLLISIQSLTLVSMQDQLKQPYSIPAAVLQALQPDAENIDGGAEIVTLPQLSQFQAFIESAEERIDKF